MRTITGVLQVSAGVGMVVWSLLVVASSGWAIANFNASEQSDAIVYGATEFERLGFSVATGDVNGDGLDDCLVGSYPSGVGMAHLFLSPMAQGERVYLATETTDVRFFGTKSYDDFGYSVAVGDWNGDGNGDVIIGSPGADHKTRAVCGAVYIYYGGSFVSGSRVYASSDTADVTIVGAVGGDGFGAGLATGFFNGDSQCDLFAVADFGWGGKGSAYVVRGGSDSSGTVIDVASSSRVQVKLYNAYSYDGVGEAIAAGDINGDGRDDLIAGISFTGPTFYDAFRGRVSVLFGSDATRTVNQASQSPDLTIWGVNDDDAVGQAVSSGDLNGDGIQDLIFQANSEHGREQDPGVVYVVNGKTGWNLGSSWSVASIGPSRTIFGEDDYDSFGEALSCGQFDGAGPEDLLIGAYGHSENPSFPQEGCVYFLRGCYDPPSGQVIHAGEDSDVPLRVIGGADTRCGYAVACGRFDEDGFEDLLIGASLGELGVLSLAGCAFIVHHETVFPPSSAEGYWLLYR